MQIVRPLIFPLFVIIVIIGGSCSKDAKWEGQGTIHEVSTRTVPIQRQCTGIFELGNGLFCSNDFAGARLNGIALTDDTLITVLITPENTPVNDSPWYAFKLWSDSDREVHLKLTYSENVKHRYYPKLSRDGREWRDLDSMNYKEHISPESDEENEQADFITMKIEVGTDTLWIAAQELITLKNVDAWIHRIDTMAFVSSSTIGRSREGRPIRMIRIGSGDNRKMIMVLSRQHPPEVTGFLAMQSFVETISSDLETAIKFRDQYTTYVVPLVNPDGVHHGHWRHNTGGIDLNRDWRDFNQPETAAIRDFMKDRVESTGGKFYFGVDFHSTYEDIYYTIDPTQHGNMPGLVPDMIRSTGEAIPGYEPNIRPRPLNEAGVTSLHYFFYEFGAESLTYEIGDNTPRDLLKRKGEISAMKLMELMINANSEP